jgi:predicted AlkP superfamily pyrophosphatase or phosphodiesterase
MKNFSRSKRSHILRIAESRIAFLLSRTIFGAFIFCTAFYCLLFYVPFSRHALFGWDVVPALSVFASHHALTFWFVSLAALLTVIPYLKESELRRPTVGLIVVLGVVGIWLSIHPLLPKLPKDERSLVAAFISVFPLCWIAALDWKSRNIFQRGSTCGFTRVSFKNIVATGACVSGVYLGIFLIRYVASGAASFNRFQLSLLAACSIALHVILFGVIFSGFRIADAISRKLSDSPKLTFVVRGALVMCALAVIMRKVVFPSVSFNGLAADLTAGAFSISFVAYFSTSLLRLKSLGSTKQPSQVTLIFEKIVSIRRARSFAATVFIAAIAIFAYAALLNLEGLDWQGLLRRISVLIVWAATFAVFRWLQKSRPVREYSLAALIPILIVGVVLYAAIQHERPHLARLLRQHAGPQALMIEQYADYDPSFSVAAEMLAPTTVDVFEGPGQDQFFAVLRENTNLPSEVAVAPKEIKLVDEIKPTRDEKPNIFIFVIDSLRQDYLSPYNGKVNFTPAVDAFARDSIVMKNAFTRYDGTALAEPSLWAGAVQMHKQFVQPFYPMNSLQKLVDAEHYRSFITIDPILKAILRPSSEIAELDRGVDWKQYDLAATLAELQDRLPNEQNRQPYFVYSQPQNLHQMSIWLNPRAQRAHHVGFEDQRASEVERLDQAFGKFLSFLKSRGLYDNSIIILTADHGESLGEGGHWGHGNAIYPELIRIPLIIHLPENVKRNFVYDANMLAFSTDITPTLYYVLGQRPIRNDAMLGRPLFTLTMEEQKPYMRDSYLIGDSYGPQYALLRDNGRTLFVANGENNQAYIYDLAHSFAGERTNIDEEAVSENKRAIVSEIQKIQAFYNYQPPSEIPTNVAQRSTIAQLYSLLFSK